MSSLFRSFSPRFFGSCCPLPACRPPRCLVFLYIHRSNDYGHVTARVGAKIKVFGEGNDSTDRLRRVVLRRMSTREMSQGPGQSSLRYVEPRFHFVPLGRLQHSEKLLAA